jgi:hypothetical protein
MPTRERSAPISAWVVPSLSPGLRHRRPRNNRATCCPWLYYSPTQRCSSKYSYAFFKLSCVLTVTTENSLAKSQIHFVSF